MSKALSTTSSIVKEIVNTRYFGSATCEEILAVCQKATEYPEGYLLLPQGEFVGHPIGNAWVNRGWLQCEYVALRASHDSVAEAADSLLQSIVRATDSDYYTEGLGNHND